MLEELTVLLAYLNNPNAEKSAYANAIVVENCLSKRTQANRQITYRDLTKLYTLDPSVTIFRVMVYFWNREPSARPLLAILSVYCRDALLRMTVPFILDYEESAVIAREKLEAFIQQQQPDRFSPATLKSTAQNLNSSWTQSGHLTGRAKKVRTQAIATPAGVAYALFLGYLMGARGEMLFETEFAKLLDCPFERAIALAEEASRRGWIVFKRVGKTIEAVFPHLLTPQEREWLREQN